MPATQARGRHLRDGSFPVGNSRSTKVPVILMASNHTQLPSQSPHRTENKPISMESIPRAYPNPVADSSQPIGFEGRFEARTAPTVANVGMKIRTVTVGA